LNTFHLFVGINSDAPEFNTPGKFSKIAVYNAQIALKLTFSRFLYLCGTSEIDLNGKSSEEVSISAVGLIKNNLVEYQMY
jgi:hypothetical protein